MTDQNDDGIRSPTEARIQKLEERQRDMIHVAEIRELIQQWRNLANNPGSGGVYESSFRRAANELEELIEDE